MSTAGHYVYTEASNHPGGTARFLTKEFDASHTDVCLQFYYSMHGASMGTLNVKVLGDIVLIVTIVSLDHTIVFSVVIMASMVMIMRVLSLSEVTSK